MFSYFPDLQSALICKQPCILAENSHQLFLSSQAMVQPIWQDGRHSKQEGSGHQPSARHASAMQEQCWVLLWLSPGFYPAMLNYDGRDTPPCCSHNSNREMTAPPRWCQKKSRLISWKPRQGVGACLPTLGLL